MASVTEAQYLSMLLIGVGSFIFGILPMVFSFRVTRTYPFCLSLILCLGAGVLLATSLVHMLTEVQPKLKLTSQLYFCAGFLALYTCEEICHVCLSAKKPEFGSAIGERVRSRSWSTRRTDYGATHDSYSENSSFDESNERRSKEIHPEDNPNSTFSRRDSSGRIRNESQQNLLDSHSNSGNSDHYHTEEVHWTLNAAAKSGLFIALLTHSILEGVSIGIQTSISQVMLVLGAVMFHKIALSFCLGLELHHNGLKTLHLLLSIFLFSIGSPIGVFVGLTVTSLRHEISDIGAQLQAVAAGSLLYVAVFEVLPRERFKWKHGRQRGAGIFQLIFVLLGFMCITVFHFVLDPSGNHEKVHNTTKKFS